MRVRLALALASLAAAGTGCANHIRRDVVATGGGIAALRGQPAQPTTTIELGRGSYDIALSFDVPRAQQIEFALVCGNNDVRRGHFGETFEAYRERRLRELNAIAERDRRAAAAVTGAVIGAVAPNVHVHGQAAAPGATASVDAHASSQQAGAAAGAVAASTIPTITELPAGDVGGGRFTDTAHVALGAPTTCQLMVSADDASVRVGYQVTQIRDLKQEAAERRVAANRAAHDVRLQLTASLETAGADPQARERQRQAEAEARERARREAEAARAEADARRAREQAERDRQRAIADAERARVDAEQARLRLEAQAKLELDARLALELRLRREASIQQTRSLLIAYLADECHADPHKRQREREAAELKIRLELQARYEAELRLRAEREAREARLRAEREAREARLRAEREREARLRAEREAIALEQRRQREAAAQRRIELALDVRADLRAYLATIGARERPPMPALIVEAPGPQPFDGAVWISGQWQWLHGQWTWTAGGWEDRTRFGDSGSSGARVGGSVRATSTTTIAVPAPTASATVSVDAGATATAAPATTTTTTTTSTATTIRIPTSVTIETPIGTVGAGIEVRDQRTKPARTRGPAVRDHRRR